LFDANALQLGTYHSGVVCIVRTQMFEHERIVCMSDFVYLHWDIAVPTLQHKNTK